MKEAGFVKVNKMYSASGIGAMVKKLSKQGAQEVFAKISESMNVTVLIDGRKRNVLALYLTQKSFATSTLEIFVFSLKMTSDPRGC